MQHNHNFLTNLRVTV